MGYICWLLGFGDQDGSVRADKWTSGRVQDPTAGADEQGGDLDGRRVVQERSHPLVEVAQVEIISTT